MALLWSSFECPRETKFVRSTRSQIETSCREREKKQEQAALNAKKEAEKLAKMKINPSDLFKDTFYILNGTNKDYLLKMLKVKK